MPEGLSTSYSFAMEEIAHYAEAERAARSALEWQPQDLWALHALTHVLEMQGRKKEGISLLEESGKFLSDYNLFRGHLWWHLAIFKFSAGAFDEALELLDREIYPGSSSFFLDIQNAVSLMLRLEIQGVSVGMKRWERLAQGSLQTATQNTVWFTTVHHNKRTASAKPVMEGRKQGSRINDFLKHSLACSMDA
jgi:tetratricopeptide (TPR) repeat protein